jgi:hypothetical protein
MGAWDDLKAPFKSLLPEEQLVGIAVAGMVVVILCCFLLYRVLCRRKAISEYEAISKDLEMEERGFGLGLSMTSDDDDDDLQDFGPVETFSEEEMRQLEMLDSYRKQVGQETPRANSTHPLSPTAETTSQRARTVTYED